MSERILVIRLERLGDLIQTTPLMLELAARGAEVEALVLENTRSILTGLPGLRQVHAISAEEVLAIEAAWPKEGAMALPPPAAFAALARWDLQPFDRVINTSHGRFASFLAREASADRQGPFEACDGRIEHRSARPYVWFHAMLDAPAHNPFNLVDLVRALQGDRVAWADLRTARPYVQRSASAIDAWPAAPVIAINPGANRPERRWPAEAFAAVARRLVAAGFAPVLVGGPADRPLGQAILAQSGPGVLDRIGLDSVPEMCAAFERAAVVLTNDTGAAHVAAAAGVPIVSLHAPCGAALTGPWSPHNIALEPVDAHLGIASIPLTAVLGATLALARGEDLAPSTLVRAFRSQAVLDDPLGGVRLVPIGRSPSASATAMRASLARHFAGWDSAIHGLAPAARRSHASSLRDAIAHLAAEESPQTLRALARELASFEAAFEDSDPRRLCASAVSWAAKLSLAPTGKALARDLWPWIQWAHAALIDAAGEGPLACASS